MSGFWDDPSVKPAASDYVKFDKVGDQVEGTIAKIGKQEFDPGTAKERMAIQIAFAEDDVPTLTAGQVMLHRALYDLKPEVGDYLTVRLVGIDKNGTKTLKRFKVAIKRANGSEAAVDQGS